MKRQLDNQLLSDLFATMYPYFMLKGVVIGNIDLERLKAVIPRAFGVHNESVSVFEKIRWGIDALESISLTCPAFMMEIEIEKYIGATWRNGYWDYWHSANPQTFDTLWKPIND